MERRILDTIVNLVNTNYLFMNEEREKWDGLCDKYYSLILNDSRNFHIIDLFRLMSDPHFEFTLVHSEGYIYAPLMWDEDGLYWIEQGNRKMDYSKVVKINQYSIDSLECRYLNAYGFGLHYTRNLILEDVLRGRFSLKGYTEFTLKKNGYYLTKKVYNSKISGDIDHAKARVATETSSIEIIDSETLYVKISSFYTPPNFKKMEDVDLKSLDNVIFDLRDNPGGYIEFAKNALSLFLNDDIVLSQYKVVNKNESYHYKIPAARRYSCRKVSSICVLINENTMSSAEYIFTLGLKTAYPCKLIGGSTMGMSGQCKTFFIDDFGKACITTQKYLDSKGDYLGSIAPDIYVRRGLDSFVDNEDPVLLCAMNIGG